MSIHVHEVGSTLTGVEFGAYISDWGCSLMRPIDAGPTLPVFICQKEVNGYQEIWRVVNSKPDGEIIELRRER